MYKLNSVDRIYKLHQLFSIHAEISPTQDKEILKKSSINNFNDLEDNQML